MCCSIKSNFCTFQSALHSDRHFTALCSQCCPSHTPATSDLYFTVVYSTLNAPDLFFFFRDLHLTLNFFLNLWGDIAFMSVSFLSKMKGTRCVYNIHRGWHESTGLCSRHGAIWTITRIVTSHLFFSQWALWWRKVTGSPWEYLVHVGLYYWLREPCRKGGP